MRKILIVLTLIVSSFFILNNNVKADTTILEVNTSYYEMINENFFEIREKVVEFANENNKYYLIYADRYGNYSINFFDSSDLEISISGRAFNLSLSSPFDLYSFYNGNLSKSGGGQSFNYSLYNTAVLLYFNFLDTNVENITYTGTLSYTIKYNDLTYLIENGNVVPSLYQIYLDANKPEEEPPVNDKYIAEQEMMNNFYLTVGEKIGNFAMNFANNYIFILILGIFILIFLFELIFRRYL